MTSTLAPSLARKARKVLETRTEAPEVLGALNTLSSFYDDNSATARRQLHDTITKRGLRVNQDFLAGADKLLQAMEKVQADLDALATCCSQGSNAVAASWAGTAEMLTAMDQIQRDLATSHTRSRLITSFLQQYELTAPQLAALQDEDMGPGFFDALDRVRAIHADCASLLRTHYQRAGLELMDAMAGHQEAAYERLCRWLQGEWRNLGDMDAPEVDPVLQKAAQALRARPVLFQHCAEEVATVRHSAIFQRFITALTRGGPGGTPRPIEVHAHDAQRYLGDMLAWLHQALASERDLLLALFGPQQQRADGAQDAAGGEGQPSLGSTTAMLDRIFESICRPLKVRIEQVLLSQPPLVVAYRVAHLLGFYAATLGPLVGRTAQLTVTLLACRALAARAFTEQLRARGDKLARRPPQPPPDLAVPREVLEASRQMAEVIAAVEAAGATEGGQATEEEVQPVLDACLAPILTACQRSAEALVPDAPSRVDERVQVDPTARPSYLLNCTCALLDVVQGHPCCSQGARQLQQQQASLAQSLKEAAADQLLGSCGLGTLADRIRLYHSNPDGSQGSLHADPELAAGRLAAALRGCFALITRPDALPEFQQLQVPRLRAATAQAVAEALSTAYRDVYTVLSTAQLAAAEPGSEASEALGQTPEHVDTILGLT